jgi:hypothetical protein
MSRGIKKEQRNTGYRAGGKEITGPLMCRGRAMAGAKDTEREEKR